MAHFFIAIYGDDISANCAHVLVGATISIPNGVKMKGYLLVESKISQIIEAAIEELGYSLVRVLYSGGQAGRNQLQIMAEPNRIGT